MYSSQASAQEREHMRAARWYMRPKERYLSPLRWFQNASYEIARAAEDHMRVCDLPDTEFQRHLHAIGACLRDRELVGILSFQEALQLFVERNWLNSVNWLALATDDSEIRYACECKLERLGWYDNNDY